MKISQQIKQQREQRHWSQADLAKRLNISRESISKWESDTALPSFTNVIKLGELFDLSLDDLIKGDDKLIHNFESHEPEPFTRLSKVVLSVTGLGFFGVIIASVLHFSVNDLRNWLSIPTFIMVIWLAVTINWTKVNRLITKKTMIIAIITLTLIMIPIFKDSIDSIIQGIAQGAHYEEIHGY